MYRGKAPHGSACKEDFFGKGACSEGMLCTVINGPKGRRGKRACYTSDMVTRNKNIRLVAKPGVSGYVKDGKRSFGDRRKDGSDRRSTGSYFPSDI